MLPTDSITRCGTPPPPANPIDDPKQLAWNDYVDEIRQQATEDCEADAWVQESLDRQAELDHEMNPNNWNN